MALSASCPISPDRVDERATRLGAGLVIRLAVLSLGLGHPLPPFLLAVDFTLRGLGRPAWSPVAQAAQALRSALGLHPQPTNAGPKRFAALIGALFTLSIAASLAFHQVLVARALATVLLLCASLEAGLGFCVGCRVHSLLLALPRRRAAAALQPHA